MSYVRVDTTFRRPFPHSEWSGNGRRYSVGLMPDYGNTVRVSVLTWPEDDPGLPFPMQLPLDLVAPVGEWMATVKADVIVEQGGHTPFVGILSTVGGKL